MILETEKKSRWMYRFDNYKRAFGLLRESVEIMEERNLTQLEKEGMIQRFEYTWELAWKLLHDYLSHQGLVLDKITPASVIRASFEAKLITNGDEWMNALDDRNKMAHIYDFKKFEKVIEKISHHYLQILDELHLSMMENAMQESEGKINS